MGTKIVHSFDELVAEVLANAASSGEMAEEYIELLDKSTSPGRGVCVVLRPFKQNMQAHLVFGPTTEERSVALIDRLRSLCDNGEDFIIQRARGVKIQVGFVVACKLTQWGVLTANLSQSPARWTRN